MPVRLDTTARTGSIADALSTGFSELQSLRDEMGGWRDNLEERLSHTEKYQLVSGCYDSLEEIAGCEEECTPEFGVDRSVNWAEQKKKSKKSPYPRWLRIQNAQSALDAAKSEMESIISQAEDEDNEEFLKEIREEGDPEEILGLLREKVDRIEEIIGLAGDIEFPGMFG